MFFMNKKEDYPLDWYEYVRDTNIHYVSLKIPTQFLIWRQPKQEYEKFKRKRLEKQIEREWIEYLEKHPILAIYDGESFIIYDWHHRTRYALSVINKWRKDKITTMPAIVYTPESFLEFHLWTCANKNYDEFMEKIAEFREYLDISVSQADFSFKGFYNWISLPEELRWLDLEKEKWVEKLRKKWWWEFKLRVDKLLSNTKYQ